MAKSKQQKDDPDLFLWRLMTHVNRGISHARVKELKKYNIMAKRAGIIQVIHNLGERAIPAEIARHVFRELPSVSEILGRMEKDGLINKSNNLERKNLVQVTLTEKGMEAYRKSMELESIHSIYSVLDDTERKQLTDILNKIWEKSLDELGEDHRPAVMDTSEDPDLDKPLKN